MLSNKKGIHKSKEGQQFSEQEGGQGLEDTRGYVGVKYEYS